MSTQVDVTVIGVDDPESDDQTRNVQYSFTCEGEKSSQSGVTIKFPQSVTIHPDDTVEIKWRLEPRKGSG